jgi:hypothetical protein
LQVKSERERKLRGRKGERVGVLCGYESESALLDEDVED